MNTGKYVQVPVCQFVQDFAPCGDLPDDVLASFASTKFVTKLKADKETDMYVPFCENIQTPLDLSWKNRLGAGVQEKCYRLVAKYTGQNPDNSINKDDGKKKSNIIIYPDRPDARKCYAHADGSYRGVTSWAWASLVVEFKKATTKYLPFGIPSEASHETEAAVPFLPSNPLSKQARGQLIEYATNVLRFQPRQFCFTIVIVGSYARLIRWDRWGAIVSTSFDFINDPGHILFRFLYKYGLMTQAERGYDPTVVEATDQEIEDMNAWKDTATREARLSSYHLEFYETAMDSRWPIYKVIVPEKDLLFTESDEGPNGSFDGIDEDGASAVYTYLTGKPSHTTYSPTGRSTKGSVAYDIRRKRLVFMGETWRVDSPDIKPEHEVYVHLWKHKVRNIDRPLSGGDVRTGDLKDPKNVQRTLTQIYAPVEEEAERPIGRIHYRLICDEVYVNLTHYKHSLSLATALLDALIAHKDAWERAGILHRDISDNNVMLQVDAAGNLVLGILIDWDLSKPKADLPKGPTQVARSGTWQFMSALLLKYPQKRHELSDDIESFVHLLNWLVLRFHEHGLSDDPKGLMDHIINTYDKFHDNNKGEDVGGEGKLLQMQSGSVPFKPVAHRQLKDLLNKVAIMCQNHYNSHSVNEEIEKLSGVVLGSVPQNDQERADERPRDYSADICTMPAETAASRPLATSPDLASHQAIIRIFYEAVITNKSQWVDDSSTKKDQFIFGSYGTEQSLNLTTRSTSKGKRKSEGSISGASKAKRSKTSAAVGSSSSKL